MSLCFLIMSCGAAVSTLLDVNTGEAKRFARQVLNNEASDLDLERITISNTLKQYITSTEGQAYFRAIRQENGQLKNLKLNSVKGSTSDTMNYFFNANFEETTIEKLVTVQAFKDREIVSIAVTPLNTNK